MEEILRSGTGNLWGGPKKIADSDFHDVMSRFQSLGSKVMTTPGPLAGTILLVRPGNCASGERSYFTHVRVC